MKLRQGVKFHDGTDFNAEAVKFSMEHLKKLNVNHDLDPVTEINVVDAYTIELKVQSDYSVLAAMLADRAGMIVSPAAVETWGDEYQRHPTGTGPYMMTEWLTGKSMKLAAFPDYWNTDDQKLKGLDVRFISNPTSMAAAVQSGQLDFAAGLDPINVPVLKANPDLEVMIARTVGWAVLWLNTEIEPVKNPKVRQAMNMAVDRAAIAGAVFGPGIEPTLAFQPLPPDYWTVGPNDPQPPEYDPAAARALLAEAGYPDGITVEYCVPATGGGVQGKMLSDIFREQMAPAGIRLDVTMPATFATCGNLFFVQKAIAGTVVLWSGRPDPYMAISQLYGPNGQYNAGKTAHPGVGELLDEILATPDREQQKPLYHQLNTIWAEDPPGVQLYFNVDVTAYKKTIGGALPSSLARAYYRSLYFK
jgi:ABC-type transport system substrate-binding protein